MNTNRILHPWVAAAVAATLLGRVGAADLAVPPAPDAVPPLKLAVPSEAPAPGVPPVPAVPELTPGPSSPEPAAPSPDAVTVAPKKRKAPRASSAAGTGLAPAPTPTPTVVAENDALPAAFELQRQVQKAADEAKLATAQARAAVARIRFGVEGPDALRLFVLPADDAPSDEVARTREQLAIMDRLLAKAVDPGTAKGGGRSRAIAGDIPWPDFVVGATRFGARGDLDALYVAGRGAVFLVNVDFPLAGTAVPKPAIKPARAADDAWEKARREVQGEPEDEAVPGEAEAAAFDAERVEKTRKALVAALRHASNLQCLRDGESVTVVVTGTDTSRAGGAQNVLLSPSSSPDARPGVQELRVDASGRRGGTVMTLRATKADIDALASGKLSADDFASRVTSTTRREPAGSATNRIGGRTRKEPRF